MDQSIIGLILATRLCNLIQVFLVSTFSDDVDCLLEVDSGMPIAIVLGIFGQNVVVGYLAEVQLQLGFLSIWSKFQPVLNEVQSIVGMGSLLLELVLRIGILRALDSVDLRSQLDALGGHDVGVLVVDVGVAVAVHQET